MDRLLFLLTILVFIGCEGPQDSPTVITETINPGLYEYRENISVQGTFVTLILQDRFSKNAAQGSWFANQLEIVQTRGNWIIVGNSILDTGRTLRTLNDAGAWGPWQTAPNIEIQARNITSTSFQEYVDYSQMTDAQKAQFQGFSSGWKTFNRISD